ncbi:phytoene/squalene synthase family protein [Paenibacillus sambharensis]|uniref:Phytoene/squalene synthase family protein n=1 Tax=Paenibacillus sambharensis TaxID=1803190 RepID=A0A2W1LAA7_9BACL|nr:phytoene/squalene synthase family protein [Paenibacillus sambharensis]PZD95070.1 phytoene/squalene synthase family protein [Paenibacillus sambharensis]
MSMLKKTSRTFYIPISRLEPGLKEAVASAYLCMRAIDEIEDHPDLPDQTKIDLLRGVSEAIRGLEPRTELEALLIPHANILPPVSVRIYEWLMLCPSSAQDIVKRYITMMSEQMAEWVHRRWTVHTVADLDAYTYSVAGMVGEMLSELWLWFDGTESDPVKAVAFGRGLQAVNILRNRNEDLGRGVDYYPEGWDNEEMIRYAKRNLQQADSYIADLKPGPALKFCSIPLALAHATVNVISTGGTKLSRLNVLEIVKRVTG